MKKYLATVGCNVLDDYPIIEREITAESEDEAYCKAYEIFIKIYIADMGRIDIKEITN